MIDLLLSDQFARYKKKELRAITEHIWNLMVAGKIEEAKGAIDMALLVCKYPTKISVSEEVKNRTEGIIKEFQSNFIRIHFD